MRHARFLALLAVSALTLCVVPVIAADKATSTSTAGQELKVAAATSKKTAGTKAKGKKTARKKAKKKDNSPVAKYLFGVQKVGAPLAPRAVGFYSKGCLAGGVQMDAAGPAWQVMRPSRNRAWGHPKLIALLKRLAKEAKANDGWPGLLVGDISQPRGGPMSSGHASHQVGLDADIWLNPMPDRKLSYREREDISAKSMLDATKLKVDPKMFTDKQFKLIKRAASYPEVERIFVNPAIKKALCERAGKDRGWLSKVRPLWGHDYHFHIRIGCTNSGCESQPPVRGDDGCGKEVDHWLKLIAKSLEKKPLKPGERVAGASDRRRVTMNQLPAECKKVLDSPGYIAAAPGAKIIPIRDAAAPPDPTERSVPVPQPTRAVLPTPPPIPVPSLRRSPSADARLPQAAVKN
jgi:penicillin-insensitive murein DD-endopeptidase